MTIKEAPYPAILDYPLISKLMANEPALKEIHDFFQWGYKRENPLKIMQETVTGYDPLDDLSSLFLEYLGIDHIAFEKEKMRFNKLMSDVDKVTFFCKSILKAADER